MNIGEESVAEQVVEQLVVQVDVEIVVEAIQVVEFDAVVAPEAEELKVLQLQAQYFEKLYLSLVEFDLVR